MKVVFDKIKTKAKDMKLLFILLMSLGMPVYAQTDLKALLQEASGKWLAKTNKVSGKFTIRYSLTIDKYLEYEMTKYKSNNPYHLVTGIFTMDIFPKRKPSDGYKSPKEFHHPFTGIAVEGKMIFQIETRESNLYINFISKIMQGEIDLKNGVKKGVLKLKLTDFDILEMHMKERNLTFTRDKSSPQT